MNQMEMLKIVEQFSRKPEVADEAEVVQGQLKVIRVQDSQTMYVETIGETGRSIIFKEYQVDGKTFWAGYSSRSETVFVSQTTRG
jgi:hypothetical protein